MEWKNVKLELPVVYKTEWYIPEADDTDELIPMESDRVLVVVKQLGKGNKYVTIGRVDKDKEWKIGEFDDYIQDLKEEVTHWMPFPELPNE